MTNIFLRIILLIPIIQILLDLVMILQPELKSIIGLLRLIFVLIVIIYFYISINVANKLTSRILIFYLLYNFILCFFTSDLTESLVDGFLKLFISLMMIPVGLYAGLHDRNYFNKLTFWMLIIMVLNYGVAQYFKIGNSLYDEDSFYSGGAAATTPIIIALCIILMLNALNTNRINYPKNIILILIILSTLIVLFSLKRGAIIAMIGGILFYLLNSTSRSIFSWRIIIISIGILFFINQYAETFNQRINARTTERNNLENENRYKESFYVFNELENSSITNLVFGREAFNSKVILKKYFGKERQLHVDYNILIHGTGILGIVLYLYLYFDLYLKSKSVQRNISKLGEFSRKETIIVKENHALIIAILISSLLMSFSGGLQFSSYRIILFLFIGYYIGQSQKHLFLSKLKTIEN